MTAVDDKQIEQLICWGEQRATVRVMLLTSTRAIPHAPHDQLSDYDVILVVTELRSWVVDRAWLNDFGEPLIVYWDPIHPNPTFGIEECSNVTQYTDNLKIDFTLWPVNLFRQIVAAPALLAELDAGYRVLLDKDHLTTQLAPPTYQAYIPTPPSLEAYQTLINDFLSDAPYVAKCLWRDELWPAKWCLDYDMKHVYLRQLLEWRIEIEQDWALPVGALGKGLKKRLSLDVWARVEQTYAGAALADNWEALAHILPLFREVAVEVGQRLGYPYPNELHQRVWAYVEQIREQR